MTTKKVERRIKIKFRIRKSVKGTAERPRMSVFRSNKQIYVQVINDLTGKTIVSASSLGMETMPKKELELVGVGYRVSNQGNLIEFQLGYTHPIFIQLPKEVKVETKSERNQNPQIILESCDKELLGLICAKIRSFRMPEPYKGKGILFKGEVIRRKSGKSASAK